MGLKGDREVVKTNPDFVMNEVASRGYAAMYSATVGEVELASSSGNFAGLILDDFTAAPTTVLGIGGYSIPMNKQKNSFYVGQPVSLAEIGTFKTDAIASGVTPAQGETAYLAAGGKFSNTGTVIVGRWDSAKDSDGYAQVFINKN